MKHLSLTSRCMIEQYIAYGYSFREIADKLGYQPSTISREVKKYRTFVTPKSPTCAKYSGCRNKSHCAMTGCADYQVSHCKKLDKAPFVCNNCPSQDFCSREHAYYHARRADAKSHAVKSSSRQSIHLDEDEVKQLNALVSPLIKNGQSLSHIMPITAMKSTLQEELCTIMLTSVFLTHGTLICPERYATKNVRRRIRKLIHTLTVRGVPTMISRHLPNSILSFA